MEDTLRCLKEVHSGSLLIILYGNSLRVYDEDAHIVEYVTHVIGREDVVILKFKYLEKLMKRLRSHHISYVALDSSNVSITVLLNSPRLYFFIAISINEISNLAL